MMIVMKEEATPEQIDSVVKRVESVGALAHISEGEVLTVIGAIGDREKIANLDLAGKVQRRPIHGLRIPDRVHRMPVCSPCRQRSGTTGTTSSTCSTGSSAR